VQLLTQCQTFSLLQNGATNKAAHGKKDFKPVVKLFAPWAGANWLLSEIDPNDHDIAFGLCAVAEIGPTPQRLWQPTAAKVPMAIKGRIWCEVARRAVCAPAQDGNGGHANSYEFDLECG